MYFTKCINEKENGKVLYRKLSEVTINGYSRKINNKYN